MHARDASAPYPRSRADEVLAREAPWRVPTGMPAAAIVEGHGGLLLGHLRLLTREAP